MNYCEKCHHINKTNICSNCGNKKLRLVNENDYCFLIEKNIIWIEILKDSLNSADIPYECVSEKGAGFALKVGPYLETYYFYVPYSHYQQAKNIINERFKKETN